MWKSDRVMECGLIEDGGEFSLGLGFNGRSKRGWRKQMEKEIGRERIVSLN